MSALSSKDDDQTHLEILRLLFQCKFQIGNFGFQGLETLQTAFSLFQLRLNQDPF